MHYVEVPMDSSALIHVLRYKKLPVLHTDLGYLGHLLLIESLETLAPSCFKVIEDDRTQDMRIVFYTMHDPEVLRELMANTTQPLIRACLQPTRLLAKPFPLSACKPGLQVKLTATVCPTVRFTSQRDRDQGRPNKKTEVDVYRHYLAQQAMKGLDATRSSEEVYETWLKDKLHARGFDVIDSRIEVLADQHIVRRTQAKPRKAVTLKRTALRVQALVTLPDAERVEQMLRRGLTPREGRFGWGWVQLHRF